MVGFTPSSLTTCACRGGVMTLLLRTSSISRRLDFVPVSYRPCVSAIGLFDGPARSETTITRPSWAHQIRSSSSDGKSKGGDPDPYKVLRVRRDASPEEIKTAWHAMVKKVHPDTSKKDVEVYHKYRIAWETIGNPVSREKHDNEVREREWAARRAQDAAASMTRSAEPQDQPKKNNTGRFINPEAQDWMKKYQKLKEETDAQKEKDRAAQKEKDRVAQREKEMAAQKKKEKAVRMAKEQSDREAALRDEAKAKSAQNKAANGNAAALESDRSKDQSKEPKREAKKEFNKESKKESRSGEKTNQEQCDGDSNGAGGVTFARNPPSKVNSESLRAVFFRLQPGTSISDVVKSLASSAVGAVSEIHITPSGSAKLEFFTADAARKFHSLINRSEFAVNGKEIKEATMQASVMRLPQGPTASRVLMLTDPRRTMPDSDLVDLIPILRKRGLDCSWVYPNRLSWRRIEVHFDSWRKAEAASRILKSCYPDIQIRYALDPASGSSEPPLSLPDFLFIGEGLPDTKAWNCNVLV
ncbi:mitochondrial DnaJ chaperone [Diaporthe amygdali]|uniref:mitochondrial DnaJ chaperone n=1 Tax=Phomopsis amygdali TaxID=1214568 RepID=UPI0022FEB304|nr:mitochondrial DnaJ chaperone [Diaporthe amygdali]KAJ0119252.1 mitochondrial DnaJ chaperone [Diaporthe amygdali]